MARWVRYTTSDGKSRFGTLDGERIAEYEGDMYARPQASGRTRALQEVNLASPCEPTKVIALWNNYRALGEKLGKPAPAHPLFLLKPATSVIGTGEAIRRPARYAGKIAFEGELGIVIGAQCTNVSVNDANKFIFGYTCVNDVTAAELIAEDPNFPQWARAKGFDTFSCIGPAIQTDLDWTSARLTTTIDGTERQNYPLSDMIFSPQEQVSRLSGDMTLYPGDVIMVGTSIGLGSMKDGSTAVVAIDGIGELRNTLTGS
jgi:2-keto-4-pentenoate hydratase/2-oxohepta-3-ene-1,7-dioic acid hydratase in catechol pathway